MPHVAAIDIGSNASRLLVKDTAGMEIGYDQNIRNGQDFYTRTPLRLGMDVYTNGHITPSKTNALIQTLAQYKAIMKEYGVTRFQACATACLRDANNGTVVVEAVRQATGITIDIISGQEEAALARFSYYAQPDVCKTGYLLFSDVGGGSTDISFCHNQNELYAHSFHVGSMRMNNHTQSVEEFQALTGKVSEFASRYGTFHIVGSGGCIHKICSMFAAGSQSDILQVTHLKAFYDKLKPLSVEQRMQQYGLKRDRAEIIVQSVSVFLNIAQAARAAAIQAPRIGVRDGIIVRLLQYPDYGKSLVDA